MIKVIESIRMMIKGCRMHGRDEKCVQNFSQKTRREQPLERQRSKWKENIRMELREMAWEIVDWMSLA
jgi:hypothetical protein